MKITVNQSLSEDLKVILGLDASRFSKLCEELEKLPIRLYPYNQIGEVVEKIDLPREKAQKISDFVLNIFYLLFAWGEEPGRTAELMADKLERFGFPRNDRETLKDRLSKLFSIRSLFVSIKSTNLFNENEKILLGSKIITDVRPVFSDGSPSKVLGYIIVHNLKLVFQDTSGSNEFIVSLGNDELDALEQDLSRARAKAKTIVSESSTLLNHLVDDK